VERITGLVRIMKSIMSERENQTGITTHVKREKYHTVAWK
jgi:hypothetical protein